MRGYSPLLPDGETWSTHSRIHRSGSSPVLIPSQWQRSSVSFERTTELSLDPVCGTAERVIEASGRTDTDMTSHDTARLYQCARCCSLTTICRRCDRGHVYCGDCAPHARWEARRRASERYQQSPEGRRRHAARQRRYRQSKRETEEKVTHMGIAVDRHVVAAVEERKVTGTSRHAPDSWTFEVIACSFCSRVCSDFLRHGFRQRDGRRPSFRDRRHGERIDAPGSVAKKSETCSPPRHR